MRWGGFKPSKRQNSRFPLNHSCYASLAPPDPSLLLSASSSLSAVRSSEGRSCCCSSSSSCRASVWPGSGPFLGTPVASESGEVSLSSCANCASSMLTRVSRSAVGITRCSVLHSCATATASRARGPGTDSQSDWWCHLGFPLPATTVRRRRKSFQKTLVGLVP
jgi:hypothetical protein